ncbi:hypothetical protein Q8A73_007010 [Channa argus]|nr:hypothetical protein Q8A73_007010 [Channa argus]
MYSLWVYALAVQVLVATLYWHRFHLLGEQEGEATCQRSVSSSIIASSSAGVVSGTRSMVEPQAGGGNMAVTAAQTETRIQESGTHTHGERCVNSAGSPVNRLPRTARRTLAETLKSGLF